MYEHGKRQPIHRREREREQNSEHFEEKQQEFCLFGMHQCLHTTSTYSHTHTHTERCMPGSTRILILSPSLSLSLLLFTSSKVKHLAKGLKTCLAASCLPLLSSFSFSLSLPFICCTIIFALSVSLSLGCRFGLLL